MYCNRPRRLLGDVQFIEGHNRTVVCTIQVGNKIEKYAAGWRTGESILREPFGSTVTGSLRLRDCVGLQADAKVSAETDVWDRGRVPCERTISSRAQAVEENAIRIHVRVAHQ